MPPFMLNVSYDAGDTWHHVEESDKGNSEYFDDTLNYIKALISKAVVYHEPKAKIKQTLEWYEEQIYEKDKQP